MALLNRLQQSLDGLSIGAGEQVERVLLDGIAGPMEVDGVIKDQPLASALVNKTVQRGAYLQLGGH